MNLPLVCDVQHNTDGFKFQTTSFDVGGISQLQQCMQLHEMHLKQKTHNVYEAKVKTDASNIIHKTNM